MWTQVAVIGSALVTVALVISSVRVGFTFLVVPIVVCESLVLALVYLLRQVFADDDEAGHIRGARQAPSRSAGLRLSEQDTSARSADPGRPTAAPEAPASASAHDRHAA